MGIGGYRSRAVHSAIAFGQCIRPDVRACKGTATVEYGATPLRPVPLSLDPMLPLKYLAGYSEDVLTQVRQLIEQGRLGDTLRQRYGGTHEVRTDRALYDYTLALKHLRKWGSKCM